MKREFWPPMKLERWCPACEECFTISEEKWNADDTMHGCGEESVAVEYANVKSDELIYKEENPQ